MLAQVMGIASGHELADADRNRHPEVAVDRRVAHQLARVGADLAAARGAWAGPDRFS